ncbi:MAG TPA: tripartite tricarboxylate transporter substrate binding protein [Usitatibacter sp.]|jgi:tripartite-type tricarboxylate transporter receptor subunit TctC|nr:tripartite tricarboxylate transporter substrate binding protein [Usitatibacter sp.]
MKKLKVFLVAAAIAQAAAAQSPAYPDKPVRVMVGFPAGGPTDIVARMFAERAAERLHASFVVENKPGANAVLAAEAVASAKPDGYTLLVAAQAHSMIPALYSDRVKFDAVKSFAPICIMGSSPTVLVVRPEFGVKTVAEFLAKVRAKPGTYTYASVGIGSAVHLVTEDFLSITKTSMTHVPYKGAPPATLALLSGEVDAFIATAGSVLPQVKAGKLVPIAVASARRTQLLPDTPTFEESGVPGLRGEVWYGLLAPAATADSVVRTLQREAEDFSRDARVRERLTAAGIDPASTCGAAFSSQIANEAEAFTRVARRLNLKVE